MASSRRLTDDQLDSLFDILIHKQLAKEVSGLSDVAAFDAFGPPLQKTDATVNSPSAPILRLILETFLVPLPGFQELPETFWTEDVHSLLVKLAGFQLSESFDSGSISARTSMGAVLAALLEYPAFLILRGLPNKKLVERNNYNLEHADDLEEAWKVFLYKCVHEDQISSILDIYSKTDKLESQSSLIQAAHRYMVLNSSAFLQYLSFVPPSASHLVNSVIKTHESLGSVYTALKLALFVAPKWLTSAAMKVIRSQILTKFGWIEQFSTSARTSSSFDIPIYNTVLQFAFAKLLAWDLGDIEKRYQDIKEKYKDDIATEYWDALYQYTETPAIRDQCRKAARDSGTVLVNGIFKYHGLDLVTDPEYLAELATYLAHNLAIHNRIGLLNTFCSNGKNEPFIKVIDQASSPFLNITTSVHKAANLRNIVDCFTSFLDGYSAVVKEGLSAPASSELPNISKFVTLFEANQGKMHEFLHFIMKAKDGPLKGSYDDYFKTAFSAVNGKKPSSSTPSQYIGLASRLAKNIQKAYSNLPSSDSEILSRTLDEYTTYRQTASKESIKQLRTTIDECTTYRQTTSKESIKQLQITLDGEPSRHHQYGIFGRVTDNLDSVELPASAEPSNSNESDEEDKFYTPPESPSEIDTDDASTKNSTLDTAVDAAVGVRAYRKVIVGSAPPDIKPVYAIFQKDFLYVLRESIRKEHSS